MTDDGTTCSTCGAQQLAMVRHAMKPHKKWITWTLCFACNADEDRAAGVLIESSASEAA